MIDLQELCRAAADLPEVTESTHFRLPAYKVNDKGFVLIEKGEESVLLSVDRDAAAAAAGATDAIEEVWRNDGKIFVGVRVDLARASWDLVGPLVENAWRNTAPARLVKAHPLT